MTESGTNDRAVWGERPHRLWQRIEAHRFDVAGDALPFSTRLARDNAWPEDHALAVLAEYRRFTFLAVVAGHRVTPSDQVDQAWHLHLLYTRDYWQVYCPTVLGAPLHHGPTRGGSAQGDLFVQQYSRTKHSYFRWFGKHPPATIWPAAGDRFGVDTTFVRVHAHRVLEPGSPPARRRQSLFERVANSVCRLLGKSSSKPS